MAVTPHVPVPEHLALPAEFEDVPGYLEMVDPDLRIRRSAEAENLYVLERRCRRAPAVNTGMRDTSDMHIQARDGYIHVASVNPAYLRKPWNIVRALREEGADLWVEGGAQRVINELDYEERWAAETRKRRRLGLYRDIASDAYGAMQRMNINGERPRISNAGTTPTHAQFLGQGAPA
jgi:hypothetical protein